MPRDAGRLTAREAAFVEQYIIHLNGAEAARQAGYGGSNHERLAYQILARPRVKAAVQEAVEARSKRNEITADRVLQELANIAFGDPRQVLDWGPGRVDFRKPADDLSPADAALVASVGMTQAGVRVKLHDKLAALRLLMAHLGMKTGDLPPAPPELAQLAALAQAFTATQGAPPHADAQPG